MKATQVAVVTPTSRERLSAARPGLLLVAFTMIILVAIAGGSALVARSRRTREQKS